MLRRELEEVGGVDDKGHEDTLHVTVIDMYCLDCGDSCIGARVLKLSYCILYVCGFIIY